MKVDGRVEAQIIALACSTTPNEEPKWTLQMLDDEVSKLDLVESISSREDPAGAKKTRSDPT